MLYIFENTDKLDKGLVKCALPLLSVQRRNKIDKYKSDIDKINGCIAFLMLKYALKKEFNIDEKPEFIFGQCGKPFLKDYPDIFFSISHCKNAVACSVSTENTAVDIMDYRKIRQTVILKVCSENEQKMLLESNDISKDFTRLWTMKECYSKLDGSGLALDFRKITAELPICQKFKYIEALKYTLTYLNCESNQCIYLDKSLII